MPAHCVAANCNNSNKDHVLLHKFQTDPKRRTEWVIQVKRNRANWTGPSEFSVLCSDHFSAECFDGGQELRRSLGFGTRKRHILREDAVPTIFF